MCQGCRNKKTKKVSKRTKEVSKKALKITIGGERKAIELKDSRKTKKKLQMEIKS